MALAMMADNSLLDAISRLGLGEMPNAIEPPNVGGMEDDPNYELKNKLAHYLSQKTLIARGQCWDERTQMGRWDLMRRCLWKYDDQNDVLSQANVYVPLISRRIDVALGNILAEILPDRTNLNFFDARSKVEHLDAYAEKSKQALRDRYMAMRPADAPTYAAMTRLGVDNFLTLGNAYKWNTTDVLTVPPDPQASMMAMDQSMAAMSPEAREMTRTVLGSTEQWIDPFNVYHWDLDVNCITQTDTSVYAPKSERQLDESGLPEEMIAFIRETYSPVPRSRRNEEDSSPYYSFWYLNQMIDRNLYNFWTYAGHWPGPDMKDFGEDIGNSEEAWAALGEEFGFTVEEARAAAWWHMEWIGWTLTVCQPWPVELPEGVGPIVHAPLFKVPGRLLGAGIYSRTEMHERLYNKLFRAVTRYTAYMANPAMWYNKSAIDSEWQQKMQARGAAIFGPGAEIPLNEKFGTMQGKAPMDVILFNVEGIAKMREHMEYLENMIGEIVGITDAIEGDDKSGTATQNANNLAQSQKTMFDYISIIESDYMLPGLLTTYTATQQCYRLKGEGYTEMVSADPSESAYRSLEVSAEDLVSLALLEFTITGSSAPGNKANQIEQFFGWHDRFAALPGLLNEPSAARISGEMIGIPNLDTLINNVTPELLMRKMENIAAMFGPQALEAYYTMSQDPQIMAGLGLMQAQMQGMAAPGVGGMGASSGQPKSAAGQPGNAPPSNGSMIPKTPAPPMMPV